uniref:Uncharacterized protein n=1 Tax=Chlamydomonas leiostraca TaxID=1034604 RepID=A0A7S0WWQ6_9CHLO|mmetsp:Transcript_32875/g.83420  ORF Transcript_32875/g.83420 Transcript_32875/m.83420 type:complete len:370 (+) Transcript_32875:140-1249(+)
MPGPAGGSAAGLHQRAVGSGSSSRPSAGAQAIASQPSEEQQEQIALAHMAQAACKPGIVIPSQLAFYVLLAMPLLVWLGCVVAGMAMFESLPVRRRDVQHWMLWFDTVFRTLAGPAMPFIVLLLRLAGSWVANRQQQCGQQPPPPSSSSARLLQGGAGSTEAHDTSGDGAYADAGRAGAAPAGAGAGAGAGGGARVTGITAPGGQGRGGSWPGGRLAPTLVPRCALVYLAITLARLLLYLLHLAVQGRVQSSTGGAEGSHAAAFMSDHILLGAAVNAGLQAELVAAVSDLVKMEAWGAGMIGQLGPGAAAVLSMALSLCVALDMHFTARFFHYPAESAIAVLLGAILFQVPVVWWIRACFKQTQTIDKD